jgi:hypothetical protein
MIRGCTPSPVLKIILETTILSISRGLPRLREITKTKDDICRQQMAGTPIVLNQHHSTRKKGCRRLSPLLKPYGTLDISISKRINKTQTI